MDQTTAQTDEEPYRDPRALKAHGILTERDIYGEAPYIFYPTKGISAKHIKVMLQFTIFFIEHL
jgi:hypothetical protein